MADLDNGNQEVASDPTRPFVYWADFEGDRVAFVNSTTGAIEASVTVPPSPVSIDQDDGGLLYVAIQGSNEIAVIDVEARSEVRSIDLTFSPLSVRVTPRDRLYVSGSEDGVLRIFVTSTGALERTIDVHSGPFIIEIDPSGHILHAATLGTTPVRITKYDLGLDPPRHLIDDPGELGGRLQQLAIDWAQGRMYVATATRSVLEIANTFYEKEGELPMGSVPRAVVAGPDESSLYALSTNATGSTVWFYNRLGPSLVRSVPLSVPAWVLVLAGLESRLLAGAPFVRVTTPPEVLSVFPDPAAPICFSPPEVLAAIRGGYPDPTVLGVDVALDGAPVPAQDVSLTFDGYLYIATARVASPFSDGAHEAEFVIEGSETTATEAWTFQIDRAGDSPSCPYVQPRSPLGGSILSESPPFVEAAVWRGYPEVGLTSAAMWFDGDPLIVSFPEPDILHAPLPAALTDGTYNVTARIAWEGAERDASWSFIVDTDFSIPRVPLDLITHPAGFRLPLPRGWTIGTDQVFEGNLFEVVATGESIDGVPSAIVVDTDLDSTVHETGSYLLEAANLSISEILAASPTATLLEGPATRRVDGHGAVTFSIDYSDRPVRQRFALILSDPHDRYWIVAVNAHDSTWPEKRALLDHILAGFEITLGPESVPPGDFGSLLPYAIPWAGGATVAVSLAVALWIRSKRRSAVGLAVVSCVKCGVANPPGRPACLRCGSPLGGPPGIPPGPL
jgi:YVTN family beta-propeller protein